MRSPTEIYWVTREFAERDILLGWGFQDEPKQDYMLSAAAAIVTVAPGSQRKHSRQQVARTTELWAGVHPAAGKCHAVPRC